MSVSRFVALATSRYASRARRGTRRSVAADGLTSSRLLLTATRKGSICLPSITGRPVESAQSARTARDRRWRSARGRTRHPSRPSRRGEASSRSRASTIARSVCVASSGTPRSSSPESLASRRRESTSGARGSCFEVVGAREPEPAADSGCLPSGRAGEQHEPHTAMNRKDCEPIVEPRDLVHLRAIEEVPSQRRSASVAHEA